MTVAVGGRSSQTYALAVVSAGQPGLRTSQLAAMVVYSPPQAKQARTSQISGLVPYEIGKFTVPRTSQVYGLIVYGTGVPNQSRTRCWTFTLDGHIFYVLSLGPNGTFVYDKTTQQWCRFITDGQPGWNMNNGAMWGTNRIVGGDSITSQVWELDPSAVRDDGWRDINHAVTGGLATRSRVFYAVDALRLSASAGQVDEETGATITMAFSDDQGKTWSDPQTLTLTADDFTEEIAWRSLGSFNAPGRIFQITDIGGIIRYDGCDAFIDNFDTDKPEGDPEG